MTPLEEFIPNACQSRRGTVGRGGERIHNLLVGDRGEGTGGEGGGIIRMGVRDGDGDHREEAFHQDGMDFCHGGAELSGGFQEGGDVVNAASVAPVRGRSEAVGGGVVEEVCGPSTLRFSDGLAEVLNRSDTRLASGGCNTGEGGLTVNVPPSEAPEVRCSATFKVSA